MAKPSDLPEWDTTQVNSIEPTQQRKDEGWLAPAGVPEKPPFQTFNYWQNEVYRWLKSINDQGILDYDNLTDYTANVSYAVGSDGLLYKCSINNGPSSTVVDPVGDATGTWIPKESIGVLQTWQDFLSSRTTGITYTNTTGRPIMVNVVAQAAGGTLTFVVSGVTVASVVENDTAAASASTLSAIVPDQGTYSVNTTGVVAINFWAELR